MQFIASISLDGRHRNEIERTLPAEQVRVRELQRQGALRALYVPEAPGAAANLWAVFDGDSQAAVQHILETLPLYPYMQVELTRLRDPEAGG